MKKSYSLSTLLLLMIIVALSLALVVTRWKFAEVYAELEVNRQRFGHIRVEDETKTYVSRITQPNDSIGTSYRIRVPEGSRYLLHLTDMISERNGFPENPEPTKSISLNGWRDGADAILSYHLYWENDAPRFRVLRNRKASSTTCPLTGRGRVGMKPLNWKRVLRSSTQLMKRSISFGGETPLPIAGCYCGWSRTMSGIESG